MRLIFYLIVFAALVFFLLVTELARRIGSSVAEDFFENRNSHSGDWLL